jgi:CBS domain containing-hemolysin-like protein
MKKKNGNMIVTIFILTFILSICFSAVSNVVAASFNEIVLFLILVLVIALGIVFDMVGMAAVSASEATFHSMSSNKIKGAKESIGLIKNSSSISSICQDVIGDVCGVISGSLGAVLAISLSTSTGIDNTIVSVLLSAFISTATVGGKAITKPIAMKSADKIVHMVGKIKNILKIK